MNDRMSHCRRKIIKFRKKGKMERRSKGKNSANIKKARELGSDSMYVNK